MLARLAYLHMDRALAGDAVVGEASIASANRTGVMQKGRSLTTVLRRRSSAASAPLGNGYLIFRRFFATIEKIGPELLVGTTGDNPQPSITGSGGALNENVLVAWKSSGHNEIRGQWLNAFLGSKQGEDFLIATLTTGRLSHPAIDGLAPGQGFIAVWVELSPHAQPDAPHGIVKGQRFGVDELKVRKIGAEFVVGNARAVGEGSHKVQPAILTLPNSKIFVVAWTGSEAGSTSPITRPFIRIFNLDGTTVGTFPINTTEGNPSHFGPRIARMVEDKFVVAWTHEMTIQAEVLAQMFNPDGSKVGGEIKLNRDSAATKAANVAVTVLIDGRFVSAWAVDEGGSVMGQLFNPDGSRVHEFELIIAATEQGRFTQPVLAPLLSGGFVAAWTEQSATSGDPSGDAVRAQAFTADGFPDNEKILVNTTTNGDQRGAAICPSAENRCVVVWVSSEGPADNNLSVRGQVIRVSQ